MNTCGGRAQNKGKDRMEGAGETEGRWGVRIQAAKVNRVGGKGLKSSVQSEDKEGEQNGGGGVKVRHRERLGVQRLRETEAIIH